MTDPALMIGKKIYALRTAETSKGQPAGKYAYRIYASAFTVKEIRIGCAYTDVETLRQYGPGAISWICEHESGNYVTAFSPIDSELISKNTVAGRATRGFLAKEGLAEEAETLRTLILQNYKNVGTVTIDL